MAKDRANIDSTRLTPPQSSREFLKAAKQRLITATFLLDNRYNLDAMYLAGYAVECSLKALILEKTAHADRSEMLRSISSGRQMHDPEILGELLKNLNNPIPLHLVKRFRRFGWSTDLRYQTGRTSSSETRGFLKAAKDTNKWVEGQLP